MNQSAGIPSTLPIVGDEPDQRNVVGWDAAPLLGVPIGCLIVIPDERLGALVRAVLGSAGATQLQRVVATVLLTTLDRFADDDLPLCGVVMLVERPHLGLDRVIAAPGRIILLRDDLAVLPAAIVAAASGLFGMSSEAATHRSRLSELSSRQLRVLREAGSGATNREIARRCHVSLPTVKRDVLSLLRYFDVANRAELMTRAIQEGYV